MLLQQLFRILQLFRSVFQAGWSAAIVSWTALINDGDVILLQDLGRREGSAVRGLLRPRTQAISTSPAVACCALRGSLHLQW